MWCVRLFPRVCVKTRSGQRAPAISSILSSSSSQQSGKGWHTQPRLFATSSPSPNLPGNDDEKEKEQPSHVKGNDGNKSSPSVLPGLGLSAAVATAGFTAAASLSTAVGVPLSGIPVSILLGMTLKNTVLKQPSDQMFKPGLTTASKAVLQTGIVCVAAKLSFVQVLATSSASTPVVLGAVGAGMWLIPQAGRLAGLPPQMTLLLTAGTSICGVTAITALAPAINAKPRDIAVAVANTVAFGTLGMLVYPYVFHEVCTASTQAGMCLGVAIHDTSQVLGAALSYKETFGDEIAFQTAAVTKLLRNLGLAVAIPALTYANHQQQLQSKGTTTSSDGDENTTNERVSTSTLSGLPTFTKYVPPFLVAFLGMSALRSVGDLALVDTAMAETFTTSMDFIGNDLSKYALGTAMAAVGLSTSAESLRGVGWKPFAVGAAGAMAVGGTGFAVATMMV